MHIATAFQSNVFTFTFLKHTVYYVAVKNPQTQSDISSLIYSQANMYFNVPNCC